MTRQTFKTTETVEMSQKRQAKEPHQIKKLQRLICAALSALLCVALEGCVVKEPGGEPVGKIYLYPDTIGIEAGKTAVLEAQHNPFVSKGDWQYQWQIITNSTDDGSLITTNIPGAQSETLIIRNAQSEDADLYRCMIYKTGKFGETNYTAVFSLQVVTTSHALGTVVTVISGSFKPGSGSSTDCDVICKNGVVFQNPSTGNWWAPAGASGTAKITDQTTGINYTATPVIFEVVDGDKGSSILCQKLTTPPKTFQFPDSEPGDEYMFCLLFTGTGKQLPPAGQKFKFSVSW